jgi:hypothetical protein
VPHTIGSPRWRPSTGTTATSSHHHHHHHQSIIIIIRNAAGHVMQSHCMRHRAIDQVAVYPTGIIVCGDRSK